MFVRQLIRQYPAVTYNFSRLVHYDAAPSTKNATEVEIKMPWGKIAGKLWGDQSKQPILALHGWQDNAATFDLLAPHLLDHGSILAIDFPGHGLSSWLPPGNMYYESVYILIIRRIQQHFQWPKVKFLSHSLGAQVTSWYASIFPDETEFVIALDHVKFPSVPVDWYHKVLGGALDRFLKIERLETEAPSYPEDVLIQKWIEATNHSVDETGCRVLMTRGMTKKPDGTYSLNRDPRVKVLPVHIGFHHKHLIELTALIKCPYLFIRGKSSPHIENGEIVHEIIEIMRKNCVDVQYTMVPGTHHFHLGNPEDTAKAVIPFLEKYN